jgi:hypothetical protein
VHFVFQYQSLRALKKVEDIEKHIASSAPDEKQRLREKYFVVGGDPG